MSFADLRSARKSKEVKSFAKTPVDGKLSKDLSTENAVPSQPSVPEVEMADAETPVVSTTAPQVENPPDIVSDIPVTLPASIEVRKTKDRGRGLYAKQSFAPGNDIDFRCTVIGKLTSRI